jgi:dTDP-4-amino-4,6-dideoxygalactose transaminase
LENRPIAFIPHKRRLKRHRVEYLKAINDALDYPFQSEDGRDLSPIQKKLQEKCISLSNLPYWLFTNCCTDSLQIAVHTLTKPGDTIIVPAYGWRAFANAVAFMNRHIEFVDIDAVSYTHLRAHET